MANAKTMYVVRPAAGVRGMTAAPMSRRSCLSHAERPSITPAARREASMLMVPGHLSRMPLKCGHASGTAHLVINVARRVPERRRRLSSHI